jgi:hypothetical protein
MAHQLKVAPSSKHMMSATKPTFSAIAAAPATAPPTVHAFHTGPWTAYYHEPEDETWDDKSYKRLQVLESYEALGTFLKELGPHKTTNGLLRIMRGPISPLWDDNANIRGGSYCLKVGRRNAVAIFERYVAAAARGICAKDPKNEIVGVTISPKKGSCIIKIWNMNAKAFRNPADILLLHDEVKEEEILYRAHTEQKM